MTRQIVQRVIAQGPAQEFRQRATRVAPVARVKDGLNLSLFHPPFAGQIGVRNLGTIWEQPLSTPPPSGDFTYPLRPCSGVLPVRSVKPLTGSTPDTNCDWPGAPASLANLNGLLVAAGEPLVQATGPEEPAVGAIQWQFVELSIKEDNHVARRIPSGLSHRREHSRSRIISTSSQSTLKSQLPWNNITLEWLSNRPCRGC